MQIINSIVQFIMNVGGATFLPIMITILGLIFGIKFFDSLKNGLRIGIGFVGISVILSLLISGIQPAVDYYSTMGSGFTVTDIGWEGLAAIAWSTPFALLIIPLGFILNFILIRAKFTKTMNVDIWNYFQFVLGAAVAYYIMLLIGVSTVVSAIIATLVGVLTSVIALKLGDAIAPYWQKYYDLPGTTCTTFDILTCSWPISFVVCWLLDRIPGVKNIKVDTHWLNNKLGSIGETSILTFIIGLLLSLITKQSLATALSMSVTLAAAIILLPRMVSLLMEGLVPISNAARSFFQKKLGDDYEINIGMDCALYLGDECGISSSIIMIPITIVLAFVLPGVNFFPIALMGTLVYFTCASALFAKGDIFKCIISTMAIISYICIMDSFLSPLVTELAVQTGYIADASTMVTGAGIETPHCLIFGLIGKLFGVW